MDFILTAKHQALQGEFKGFANTHIEPAGKTFPKDNLDRMARQGYMGLPIPPEWGGRGEDFFSYILLIEEISRVCASTGVILSVHTSVGTFPLLKFGNMQQKERYLRGLARGELLGAFALTEGGAGSDATALRTSARRVEGKGYVLDGCKLFITSGGEADLYTVFATLDSSLGSKGICAFLVEKGTPGLSIGQKEKKMGLHGSATTELRLEGVKVAKENLLGGEGEGFKIAMSLLDGGRIGIAAQGLGLVRASLDTARDYLQRADAAGMKMGESSAGTLADLYTALEGARLLVYQAALAKEAGLPCSKEASMAKLFATDLSVKAATLCIDICRPAELMFSKKAEMENPLYRYFCDAKITQIYEGTNQIQRLVIARNLLKQANQKI